MGTTKKYHTEEDREQSITRSKTKYMLSKSWICPLCPAKNYTLAGKHMNPKLT